MKKEKSAVSLWKRLFTVYLDDILIVGGIGFLTAMGFVLHIAAGFGVLGVGCIAFGVIVARGGGRR